VPPAHPAPVLPPAVRAAAPLVVRPVAAVAGRAAAAGVVRRRLSARAVGVASPAAATLGEAPPVVAEPRADPVAGDAGPLPTPVPPRAALRPEAARRAATVPAPPAVPAPRAARAEPAAPTADPADPAEPGRAPARQPERGTQPREPYAPPHLVAEGVEQGLVLAAHVPRTRESKAAAVPPAAPHELVLATPLRPPQRDPAAAAAPHETPLPAALPTAAAPAAPAVDTSRIANAVYDLIVRRLGDERARRGW
jgi:hypothetical protein